MDEVSRIWSSLDDMAQNNPLAYKKYIEKKKKEATWFSRIIQPAYFIKAKGADGSRNVLNICKSKAVAAPVDPTNIPTLVSDLREFKDETGINQLKARENICL